MKKRLCVLLSFTDKNIQRKLDRLKEITEGRCEFDFFLDSGAFTAYYQGIEIDIDKYIHFIYDNHDSIKVYANLDVIGSVRGSEANEKILRDSGLNPLPVVHYAWPQAEVRRIADRSEYFAIGGPQGLNMEMHIQFTKLVFQTAHSRNPDIKIHGFGITSPAIISAVPYHSVDSTSWLCGRYGDIRLYDPESKTINFFQRCAMPTFVTRYQFFRNTLRHYGLTPSDFVQRKDIIKYEWASMKGYLHFSEEVKRYWNYDEFKIYFVSVETWMLEREGWLEYLFTPLGSPFPEGEYNDGERRKEKEEKARHKRNRKKSKRKSKVPNGSSVGSGNERLESERDDAGRVRVARRQFSKGGFRVSGDGKKMGRPKRSKRKVSSGGRGAPAGGGEESRV